MNEPRNIATLGLVTRDNVITLGEKKRGFKKGTLNGPGGKTEPGEGLVDCFLRELEEEMGIRLSKEAAGAPVAVIDFYAAGTLDFRVYVFRIDGFEGTAVETEEMAPEEHPLEAIPYERMMEGDRHWFPLVLRATPERRLKIVVRYREAGTGLLEEPMVEPWN